MWDIVFESDDRRLVPGPTTAGRSNYRKGAHSILPASHAVHDSVSNGIVIQHTFKHSNSVKRCKIVLHLDRGSWGLQHKVLS